MPLVIIHLHWEVLSAAFGWIWAESKALYTPEFILLLLSRHILNKHYWPGCQWNHTIIMPVVIVIQSRSCVSSLSFPQLPPVTSFSSLCLSRYLFLQSRLCVCLSPLTLSRPLLCLSLSLIPWSASRPLFVPRSLSLCCLCFVCMRPSVCVFLIHPVLVCQSLVLCVFHVLLCSLLSFVCPCVYLCPCRRLSHSLAVCSLPVRVVPSFFQFAFMYFALQL